MNTKIKVVLIDDEISPRIICRNYLSEFSEIEIAGEASTLEDAKTLIDAVQPNIVLLDIHLGNTSGFDLLKHYTNPNFNVIFITAYDQYAIKAIKAGALDYLLKPIDQEELKKAIEKSKNQSTINPEKIDIANETLHSKKAERISLSANDGYHIVWVKDIIYCSASGNYTTFHIVNNKQIVISKILKEYENLLPANTFLRVHQSYLVNMNYIERFTKDQILILQNGAEVMVASRKKDEVINWLKEMS